MCFDKVFHGADYNPEQWKETPEIIDEDMRLMKLAHCNVMSINIFSWTELEPSEGVYDFSFLDEIMDKLNKNGIKAILATPSAARPAWMSKAHPEVLRVNADRTKNLHGVRHNHCYTSPYYRQKVSQINQLLAKRYKDHPALLMWHISNEFGGECHCELCQAEFRKWLKNKYNNDLAQLNQAYWSRFWSHTYTDWEEIESPSPLGESQVHALNLDWKRFVTYQTMDFIKTEIAPLRKFTPDIPVTANLMEVYPGLDYFKLKNVIDIVSWDNYPKWHSGNDIEIAQNVAFMHDMFRSLKQQPFFLMESTPSMVNWCEYNKHKRPKMHSLSSLQAVAHGSNSVQYFQWRKSRGSVEKLHGAVVDHCGHEGTRVFREVSELGETLSHLQDIPKTNTVSEVAVLYDWENRWAIDDMQGLAKSNRNYVETCIKHYMPFWKRGINVDVIDSDCDFSKYKLIAAPMLYMIKSGVCDKIKSFVENGGRIVFTYVSGWVDENDLCFLGGFPAKQLKDVFGIWAEETDVLYPNEENAVKTTDNKIYRAVDYCEVIHSNGAEVMATYCNDYYAEMPAATVNSFGKGKAYYIAFRDCGDFLDMLYGNIIDEAKINREIQNLPEGVTAHTREDKQNIYVFIENYNTISKTILLSAPYTNIISGEPVCGEISLDKYRTLILKRAKKECEI